MSKTTNKYAPAAPVGLGNALPAVRAICFSVTLTHSAELTDPTQHLLVVYSTSHGARACLACQYSDSTTVSYLLCAGAPCWPNSGRAAIVMIGAC